MAAVLLQLPQTHPMKLGVALTTRNRPGLYERNIKEWRANLPPDAVLAVVDDASDPPADLSHADTSHRFDTNMGVAVAKNRCLELLVDSGVRHVFLADDDTRPVTPDWWEPYVASPEPHLMYQPLGLPSHWRITPTGGDDNHVAFDKPRGCLIYIDTNVLPVVGGMSVAFGKHGAEHGNWSDRIHTAGLTTWPYADVAGAARFRCDDEDHPGLTTGQPAAWRKVDPARIPLFCDYRVQPVPVLAPRRLDGGHRDRLWRHARTAWETAGYRVIEGHHVEGPFNRSLAVNLAADLAGNWPVALIVDADALIDPTTAAQAIARAVESNRLCSPFTEVHELTPAGTEAVLSGASPEIADVERVRTAPSEIRSMVLAVPRNCWEQARGFDPGFVGWGGEDEAFWEACTAATGTPDRLAGPVFHLWHQPASRQHQRANIQRLTAQRRRLR